jgi:UDP:flavonoid glycosyltransferase YjiC (YdhE family)
MTKFLWLCHSSGGNLPPSLGVAQELIRRGHEMIFAGRDEMPARVEAEGLRARLLPSSYAQQEKFPSGSPMGKIGCALTSPNVVDDIHAAIDEEQPDILIVDAMFPAALVAASQSDLPSVVFCHTFFYRQLDEWQDVFNKIAGMHAGAGFAPWPTREDLWKAQDHVFVTSVAALDDAPLPGWDHVRHVGPVLDTEEVARPIDLPFEDEKPLVLLSLSTTELASLERLQTALDALADLPVNVIATSSPLIDPANLAVPANAHVVSYIDHDPILERAALTVTHGGHGTLMRTLRAGVPAVVIPGMPHDQVPNGALLAKHGAGIPVAGDADAAAIRAAARAILQDPSYSAAAQALAPLITPLNGAKAAADGLEGIAAHVPPAAAVAS